MARHPETTPRTTRPAQRAALAELGVDWARTVSRSVRVGRSGAVGGRAERGIERLALVPDDEAGRRDRSSREFPKPGQGRHLGRQSGRIETERPGRAVASPVEVGHVLPVLVGDRTEFFGRPTRSVPPPRHREKQPHRLRQPERKAGRPAHRYRAPRAAGATARSALDARAGWRSSAQALEHAPRAGRGRAAAVVLTLLIALVAAVEAAAAWHRAQEFRAHSCHFARSACAMYSSLVVLDPDGRSRVLAATSCSMRGASSGAPTRSG